VSKSHEDLIVAFQAAKLLDIEHQRMYAMVRSGVIPAQRRSGRWWIKLADLDAALERARGEARPVVPQRRAAAEGQLERVAARMGRPTGPGRLME